MQKSVFEKYPSKSQKKNKKKDGEGVAVIPDIKATSEKSIDIAHISIKFFIK